MAKLLPCSECIAVLIFLLLAIWTTEVAATGCHRATIELDARSFPTKSIPWLTGTLMFKSTLMRYNSLYKSRNYITNANRMERVKIKAASAVFDVYIKDVMLKKNPRPSSLGNAQDVVAVEIVATKVGRKVWTFLDTLPKRNIVKSFNKSNALDIGGTDSDVKPQQYTGRLEMKYNVPSDRCRKDFETKIDIKPFKPTIPKVVAPKVVAPKVVAPKVVAPKVVAPKVVAPKKNDSFITSARNFTNNKTIPNITGTNNVGKKDSVAKVVAPKVVAPKVVAPKVVAPKVVAPKVVAPKVVAPKVVAPKVVAPKKNDSFITSAKNFTNNKTIPNITGTNNVGKKDSVAKVVVPKEIATCAGSQLLLSLPSSIKNVIGSKSWFKDNVPIIDTTLGHYKQLADDGLLIQNVSGKDKGRYAYKINELADLAVFNVIVTEISLAAHVREFAPYVGDSVVMRVTSGSKTGYNTWYFGNKQLPKSNVSKHYEIKEKRHAGIHVLTIKDIQLRHSGRYKFIQFFGSCQGSVEMNVNVREKSIFDIMPKGGMKVSVKACRLSNVTLEIPSLILLKLPSAPKYWFKDGVGGNLLLPKYGYSKQGNLVMNKVDVDDAGKYEVKAINKGKKEVLAVFDLFVPGSTFETYIRNYSFAENKLAVVKIEANKYGVATWYFNDTFLSNSTDIKFSNIPLKGNKSSVMLKIRHIKQRHSGHYKMTYDTDNGCQESAEIFVHVFENIKNVTNSTDVTNGTDIDGGKKKTKRGIFTWFFLRINKLLSKVSAQCIIIAAAAIGAMICVVVALILFIICCYSICTKIKKKCSKREETEGFAAKTGVYNPR